MNTTSPYYLKQNTVTQIQTKKPFDYVNCSTIGAIRDRFSLFVMSLQLVYVAKDIIFAHDGKKRRMIHSCFGMCKMQTGVCGAHFIL